MVSTKNILVYVLFLVIGIVFWAFSNNQILKLLKMQLKILSASIVIRQKIYEHNKQLTRY